MNNFASKYKTWHSSNYEPYISEEDEADLYVATNEGDACGWIYDLGYYVDCSEGLLCEADDSSTSTDSMFCVVDTGTEADEETTC